MLLAVLFGSHAASSLEARTPPLTAATSVGEWVAHWHGPERENLVLLSFDLSHELRGTFVRTRATGESLAYAITGVKVESGKFDLNAVGTGQTTAAKLGLRGTGWASEGEGWIDAIVTETTKGGSVTVFQVRFEKAPDKMAAKLGRMLLANRRARKAATAK
jgi:hypothetical protein